MYLTVYAPMYAANRFMASGCYLVEESDGMYKLTNETNPAYCDRVKYVSKSQLETLKAHPECGFWN